MTRRSLGRREVLNRLIAEIRIESPEAVNPTFKLPMDCLTTNIHGMLSAGVTIEWAGCPQLVRSSLDVVASWPKEGDCWPPRGC